MLVILLLIVLIVLWLCFSLRSWENERTEDLKRQARKDRKNLYR